MDIVVKGVGGDVVVHMVIVALREVGEEGRAGACGARLRGE